MDDELSNEDKHNHRYRKKLLKERSAHACMYAAAIKNISHKCASLE